MMAGQLGECVYQYIVVPVLRAIKLSKRAGLCGGGRPLRLNALHPFDMLIWCDR